VDEEGERATSDTKNHLSVEADQGNAVTEGSVHDSRVFEELVGGRHTEP